MTVNGIFGSSRKDTCWLNLQGTDDCEETKLLLQKHLYDIVMTRKEQKHFDPNHRLEWRNYFRGPGGDPEIVG
jgi:hypothetical protein